jgi:hypothetical protein
MAILKPTYKSLPYTGYITQLGKTLVVSKQLIDYKSVKVPIRTDEWVSMPDYSFVPAKYCRMFYLVHAENQGMRSRVIHTK